MGLGSGLQQGASGSNWLTWDMLRKKGLEGGSREEGRRESQDGYKQKRVGHLRFLLLPTPLSRFLLVEGKCF